MRIVRGGTGASQHDFAESLGVSFSAYKNYEKGSRSITKDVIVALQELHHVDPIWLLTGEGDIWATGSPLIEGWRYLGSEDDLRKSLKTFGRRVKEARERLGLSLADVASKTGMSEPVLEQVELGEQRPPLARLKQLGAVLMPDGPSESLFAGIEHMLAAPPVRIRKFGSVVALTFNRGGAAHVSFTMGDVMKIIFALVELESKRPNPNPATEALKDYLSQRYWLPEEEDDPDGAIDRLDFLAEVPIAVHGVELNPIWPPDSPISNEQVEKFREDFARREEQKGPD